jgi:hypothetical protein
VLAVLGYRKGRLMSPLAGTKRVRNTAADRRNIAIAACKRSI